MPSLKDLIKKNLYISTPQKFSVNFKTLNISDLDTFKVFLNENYYKKYFIKGQSVDLQNDLQDQLHGRLRKFREEVVPWLDNVKQIKGATILEVGCGTGSSTVAFAEQGARVTAVDIDEGSISVAKKRIQLYGLDATFVLGNGEEIDRLFAGKRFDFIIFSATLEHMKYSERINALRAAKALMVPGDFLAVVETPNRLWFYDFHTAYLPFYFWLPDELAFDYASHSRRKNFSEIYSEKNPDQMLHFIRRGRGVSFHDFEIAFTGMQEIKAISSLEGFRKKPLFRFITDRLKSRGYFTYKKFIRKLSPTYHEGFFEPWLDLIFKKIK